MPGYDETIPPPPRDPVEEAARQAKLRELETKLTELEARAAESADPARDVADSQHADSEGAECWLTGSQAVAILNTSRRFLLNLAEANEIDSHVDPTGRRVYSARSVQAYKERDDGQRREAADELSRLGQEIEAAAPANPGATSRSLGETPLRWGEGVTSDASRTGQEVGVPVCDDDGREIGEMRMSYANAGVLGAMLTDAAEGEPTPAEEPREGVGIGQHIPPDQWPIPYDRDAVPFDPVADIKASYGYIAKAYADRAPTAYQRGMQIAEGRDPDAEPSESTLEVFRVAITQGWRPRLDDLSDNHLDVMYALIAKQAREIDGLIARDQPETWLRQAGELARQAKEIGDLRATVERVRALHRREPLYVVDCDCPRPDEAADYDSDAYDDYDDNHSVNVDGDTACLKQPQGADCGHCRDGYGDTVPWPCPTIAALDGDTPKDET